MAFPALLAALFGKAAVTAAAKAVAGKSVAGKAGGHVAGKVATGRHAHKAGLVHKLASDVKGEVQDRAVDKALDKAEAALQRKQKRQSD